MTRLCFLRGLGGSGDSSKYLGPCRGDSWKRLRGSVLPRVVIRQEGWGVRGCQLLLAPVEGWIHQVSLCLAQTRGDSFRGGMRVKEEGCGAGHVTGRSRAASFTSSAGGSLCKRHTLREGVPSGSTSPWSVLHLLDPEGQGRGQGMGGGLTPSLEQLARPGEQGAETEQGHLWGSACCRCLEVPDTSWPSEGVY